MAFTGTVKSFGADKGFGFIHSPEPGGPDIFVHIKACVDGMTPQMGDTLTFDVEESKSKEGQMVASNVSGGSGGMKGAGKSCGKAPGAMCGTVKTYNLDKGFGFIVGPDGADVFLHANAITDGSLPQQGDYVSYDSEPSKSKPGQMVAQNVQGGTGAKGKGKGYGGGWGDSWGGKGGGYAPPVHQGQLTLGANQGQVKSFNPMKGFGFLTLPDGSEVFFHHQNCVDGSTPQVGDTLIFDMEPSRTKEGQMIAKNLQGGTGMPGGDGGGGKGNGKDSWGDSWDGGYGAAKGDSWDGGKGGPYGGDKGGGKAGKMVAMMDSWMAQPWSGGWSPDGCALGAHGGAWGGGLQ